jgi:L-methionine (R)-S-oxide reductase
MNTNIFELIEKENPLGTLANITAFIMHEMPDLNWVGFYIYNKKELVLGPFQGKLACTKIPLNRGVCGFAARERKTTVVDDVHTFADHIACDSASNSELVVPIIQSEELFAVLDLDSPTKARFNTQDMAKVEELVLHLTKALDFKRIQTFFTY